MDDTTRRSSPAPRVPGGNAPSGEALEHWSRVVAFARQLVPSRESAEDLAQEAYLRFYRGASRARKVARDDAATGGTHDERGLLLTIVLNLARSKSRRKVEFDLEFENAVESTDADPLALAIGGEEKAKLAVALAALQPAWRAALFLADGLDASYAEIASVLGTSEDVVRTTLHRARRRLRETLSRRLDEELNRGQR